MSHPQTSEIPSDATTAVTSFADLGLRRELLRALEERGYRSPTPIQAAVIPTILNGKDVFAGAQTGTGKTAGFTLPLLQLLMAVKPQPAQSVPQRRPHPRRGFAARPVRALVLAPTRELAAQVEESIREYGKHLPLVSTAVYGGVGINPQIRALAHGVDILVATPGRLMDHASQHTVDLRQVEILVLDEADRMLDMGFIRDIQKILTLLPEKRQNLLFSATCSSDIKALADNLLNAPEQIAVGEKNAESSLVTQSAYLTTRDNKRALLLDLIHQRGMKQALIFTKTKHGADRLAGQLEQEGIPTATIHSNRSQSQRMAALADFKDGTVRMLVATDIAARGLDIVQLPFVINYDLPMVAEDYVHRIGRTGRAGSVGEAISLISSDEHKYLNAIERLLKRKLDRKTVEDKHFPSLPSVPAVRREEVRTPALAARPLSAEPRPRTKPKLEVQWGDKPRPPKGISAVPRHKRKPGRAAQTGPAPFARFMPSTGR